MKDPALTTMGLNLFGQNGPIALLTVDLELEPGTKIAINQKFVELAKKKLSNAKENAKELSLTGHPGDNAVMTTNSRLATESESEVVSWLEQMI